jgi:hypothetical protein
VAAINGRRVSLAREGVLNFIFWKRYYRRDAEGEEKIMERFEMTKVVGVFGRIMLVDGERPQGFPTSSIGTQNAGRNAPSCRGFVGRKCGCGMIRGMTRGRDAS